MSMYVPADTPQEIVDAVRELKEAKVADPEITDFDLRGYLVFLRDGEVVARVYPAEMQHTYTVIRMGCVGYAADRVITANDAFAGTKKWHDTGRGLPKAGQLQRMFKNGRTDLVTESIIVTWLDRGSPNAWGSGLNYVLDAKARKVTWTDASGVMGPLLGDIPAAMHEGMQQDDVLGMAKALGFPPSYFDLTEREARIKIDMTMTKMLVTDFGCGVLMGTTDADARVELHGTMDDPRVEMRNPFDDED